MADLGVVPVAFAEGPKPGVGGAEFRQIAAAFEKRFDIALFFGLLDNIPHVVPYAGKMFQVSPDVYLKPSTIVRKSVGGPTQFDLNLGAMYKNRYWLTATYRYQFGAVISAHIYVNDNFHFGYAYDLPLNSLLAEQSGTHELFIGYDFNIFKKQTTPRFF